MRREDFLANVRQAALAGRAYRVTTAPVPPGTGYVGAAGDLCTEFAREVYEVGGEPILVANDAAALEAYERLVDQYQMRSVVSWHHPLLERIGARAFLARRGIEWWDYSALASLPVDERRAKLLAAGGCLSSVDFAIAETGTLLVCAKPGQERLASLIAPVYVTIVERAQIVPDLFDAFAKLGELGFDDIPSNIALITGPSKTGDIELQLTTGVHGPGKWHVIVIAGQ